LVCVLLLLLCSVGVHWSICKRCYNISNISYFNSAPPLLSFIPSLLFPEQSEQVSFLLTCVDIIWTTSPTPLDRVCSALLFFNFVEEKT
jgi:hypothetical protein